MQFGGCPAGLERKAGSSRRTDQVQGEELLCITDSMGSCKLGKHVVLEITEVRYLQWEPILGNISCQQNCKLYGKHAGSCRGRAGKGVVNV